MLAAAMLGAACSAKGPSAHGAPGPSAPSEPPTGPSSAAVVIPPADLPNPGPSSSLSAPPGPTGSAPPSASPKPRPSPRPSPQPGGGCGAEQLKVTLDQTAEESGGEIAAFTLANLGHSACALIGYPDLTPFGSGSLTARVVNVPAGQGVAGTPPAPLSLQPGSKGVFFLVWQGSPVSGGTCQDAAGFIFSAPQAPGSQQVAFAFRFCGEVLLRSAILPGEDAPK